MCADKYMPRTKGAQTQVGLIAGIELHENKLRKVPWNFPFLLNQWRIDIDTTSSIESNTFKLFAYNYSNNGNKITSHITT